MTFEDMKKIVVDTLNCEEEKVTMEASLTEDLEADSLDAHADAEALLGSVQGLEDGGSLVILLEVTGGAIVQMQDDAAAACGDLFHEAVFIKIFDAKHNKYLRVR